MADPNRPYASPFSMIQRGNALAAALAPEIQSQHGDQPSNVLNPAVPTPFGWLPPDLASRFADYLPPEATAAPLEAAGAMTGELSRPDGQSADFAARAVFLPVDSI
jgi:hypothetical protein